MNILKENLEIIGRSLLFTGASFLGGLAVANVVLGHSNSKVVACSEELTEEEKIVTEIPPACSDFHFDVLDTTVRGITLAKEYRLPPKNTFIEQNEVGYLWPTVVLGGTIEVLLLGLVITNKG